MVLKFYGITKYHGIVIINYCIHLKSFKLLLCPETKTLSASKFTLKSYRWFPQVYKLAPSIQLGWCLPKSLSVNLSVYLQ